MRAQNLVPDAATGRHRVIPDKPCDFEKVSNFLVRDPAVCVANHTKTRLLHRSTKLAAAQPYLHSGRRAVELHLVEGNEVDVAANLASAVSSEREAYLLRGTIEEQQKVLSLLGKTIDRSSRPKDKWLENVPERLPQVTVASNAALIVNARIESKSQTVSEESLYRAQQYTLKKSSLTPAQVTGVGFALDHKRSLIADETGGGKTLQSAVAAEIQTPPDRKTLVVCPPGLIAQWVDKLDQFVPAGTGVETKPENCTPDWLMRLSGPERTAIMPAWERVRKRFVFLPESALQGGLKISRGVLSATGGTGASVAAKNASQELNEILTEPISTVIIDEGQGYRVAGPKFTMLDGILSGKVKAKNAKIENVVLATATPLYRDAPDLYSMLKLLGIPRFRKMDLEDFCKDYCQRKIVVKDGERMEAAAVAPYGYGMLKEDKIPEVAGYLSGFMISRSKEELAPGRTRKKTIESPMPYEPSPTLGVALDGMITDGTLVPVDPVTAAALDKDIDPNTRRKLLADAKVDRTVQDVIATLGKIPKGEKIVVYSQFIETAATIVQRLAAAGVKSHSLSSREILDGDGRQLDSKAALVKSFVEDTESPVLTSTIIAGGTGIDGLHKVSRREVFNDCSPVPGAMVQAEGRVWRIEDLPVPPDAPPAHMKYLIADHPLDKRDWKEYLERRHAQEYIRSRGMFQSLDSPEAKAVKEMAADEFHSRILTLIGAKPETKRARDNTYLTAREFIDAGETASSESALKPTSVEQERAAARKNVQTLELEGPNP